MFKAGRKLLRISSILLLSLLLGACSASDYILTNDSFLGSVNRLILAVFPIVILGGLLWIIALLSQILEQLKK